MLRCRRCNQVIASLSIACTCSEMFIAVATKENVRLYINPDPHTHQEETTPPQPKQITIEASSTAVSGQYLPLASWNSIPGSSAQWRMLPLST
jgi:hypothetical protein